MNTLFTGQNIVRLSKIDSTNAFAGRLLNETSVPEGTVIIAEEQTHGRGQRGTNWQSEPGKNLTFSLILKPSFLRADKQFVLNKAISLAVADFIKLVGITEVKIKWPNDILIKGKKVAGILIENQIRNAFISGSIVGIGININQSDFQNELADATSIRIEKSKEENLNECFEQLCECLEKRYLALRGGSDIDSEYLKMLFKYNERVIFEAEELRFFGTIKNISEEGKLQILTDNDVLKSFDLKQIKFIRTEP
jgi:BirA family transcriptional regulator, biotin operon repressor / biotin---[acetyl-CoA-carboxylase] ligase